MPANPDRSVSVLDLMCKDRYAEAEEHKRRRDEFAAEARNWALRRDQYRERSKDALREAKGLIPGRDAINAQVKEIKERRDRTHAEAAELKGKDKEAFQTKREEANRIHEEMLAAVEKGHALNDKITGLFEESKVDTVLSQAAHRKFVECRKGADQEHRLYLETLGSVRGLRDEYTKAPDRPGSEYRCPRGQKGRDALDKMNEHHAPLAEWALGLLPDTDPQEVLDIAGEGARRNGCKVEVSHDPVAGVAGANILYTDVWASMGEEKLFQQRLALLRDYQVNMAMVQNTGNADPAKLIFLHCLPAFHDNQTEVSRECGALEVTDEVFESAYSKVFDEAENRLHTIKAMIVASLAKPN